MTARGFYTLLFGALMLFTALSVGSAGAFLLGTAALLCWALSLLCVCAAALSCRAEQQLEGGQTQRGGTCRLILRVRFALPAPIAPLSLRVELPSGRQSDFSLSAGLLGLTESDHSFVCPHVGVFPVGVSPFGAGCAARSKASPFCRVPSPPTRCPSAPARAKARRPSARSPITASRRISARGRRATSSSACIGNSPCAARA